MQVTTVGLDLAKDVFQIHGVTTDGTVLFNRSVRRAQLLPFFEKLPRASSAWKLADRQQLPRRRSPGHPRSGEGSDLDALRPTDGALWPHLHVFEAGRAAFPSRQARLAVAFDPRRRPDDGFSHRRDDRRWEAVSKRTRTGGLARIDAVEQIERRERAAWPHHKEG